MDTEHVVTALIEQHHFPGDNRRTTPRHYVTISALVKLDQEQIYEPQHTVIVDISLTGVGILVMNPIAEGERITIDVSQHFGDMVRLHAEVYSCLRYHEHAFRVGAGFSELQSPGVL